MIKANIGKNISSLRKDRNMSQAELAKAVGVGRPAAGTLREVLVKWGFPFFYSQNSSLKIRTSSRKIRK